METETKTIKELIIETKLGTSPGRLSEIMVELSAHYALLSQEFEDIIVFMADRWLELRVTTKSDNMAEKLWNATEEGKKLTRLKIQTKYIEKVISSIKLRLRVLEGESRNQY